MKFYILNQVWGTNFIPDDSADFGFKNFFIPKTTILLPYRCVWKWLFPKYCHYFSFYDFGHSIKKKILIYFRPRIGGQVILDSGLKGIVSKIDTRGKVVVQLQDSNEIKKISFSSVFNSRFV